MAMTNRERYIAAAKGEKVDRVPIWLREGFERIDEEPPNENNLMTGWKTDPLYKELYDYVAPYCTFNIRWQAHGFNRLAMIPPKYVESRQYMLTDDIRRIEGTIHTAKKDLTFVDEVRRGSKTTWRIKEPVETAEDLAAMLEVPFELDEEKAEQYMNSYNKALSKAGDNGVLLLPIPSPIVAISSCMSFENFLEMSIAERGLLHEALEEVTRRTLLLIDRYFKDKHLDTIVNIGGSEQCTPPIMSPQSFDELVVPYDGPMVKRLKEYGVLVSCHCHGKVRHALPLMVQMGYDSTDPVEPPPSGDVTYEEARRLTDGKITLLGNLEWNELEHSEPEHIKKRIKDILSYGNDRLILAASAGPISRITPKCANNYKAWIDAVNEFYE